MTIGLGWIVKDRITGFQGVVIGRTAWLTGCATVGVRPRELKDGKIGEPEWLDETQVEVISKGDAWIGAPKTVTVEKGGPHETPSMGR